MKSSDLIVVGLAGVALYMIWRSQTTATGGQTTVIRSASSGAGAALKPADSSWVSEIFDATGRLFDNGWRYFDNGVAIDPQGNYYRDGQMIWQNTTITA